jgi:hypothetical protein
MPTSGTILREAAKLVKDYFPASKYYADQCRQALDPENLTEDPEFSISLHTSNAQKLTDLVESRLTSVNELIEYIEYTVKGFYVKNIYTSKNWACAYQLLTNFRMHVLADHKFIADEHFRKVEEFKEAPKVIYYPGLPDKTGDYLADIEEAIYNASSRAVANKGFYSDDICVFAKLIIELVYCSCYAIKKRHNVGFDDTEWNRFRLELYYWYLSLHETEVQSSNRNSAAELFSPTQEEFFENISIYEKKLDRHKTYKENTDVQLLVDLIRVSYCTDDPTRIKEYSKIILLLVKTAQFDIMPKYYNYCFNNRDKIESETNSLDSIRKVMNSRRKIRKIESQMGKHPGESDRDYKERMYRLGVIID